MEVGRRDEKNATRYSSFCGTVDKDAHVVPEIFKNIGGEEKC
jgi:hypothetical protein